MFECNNYTEKEYFALISEKVKEIDSNFQLFTLRREYSGGSYYTAFFVLRTTVNNYLILDSLLKLTIETDGEVLFTGSEQDVLGNGLEKDSFLLQSKINIQG